MGYSKLTSPTLGFAIPIYSVSLDGVIEITSVYRIDSKFFQCIVFVQTVRGSRPTRGIPATPLIHDNPQG